MTDSAAPRPRWPRGIKCDCCRQRVWVIALRVKTIYGDVVRYCATCAEGIPR